jgi:hypothetical protein
MGTFADSLVKELTPGLNPPIPGYGCIFLSLAAMAQMHFGMALSVAQVNELWVDAAKDSSIIQPSFNLGVNGRLVATLAGQMLGQNYHVKQVGVDGRYGQGMHFENDVIDQADYHIDYVILWHDCIIDGNPTPSGHYILGDNHSKWIYNSNPSLKLGRLKAVLAYQEV